MLQLTMPLLQGGDACCAGECRLEASQTPEEGQHHLGIPAAYSQRPSCTVGQEGLLTFPRAFDTAYHQPMCICALRSRAHPGETPTALVRDQKQRLNWKSP